MAKTTGTAHPPVELELEVPGHGEFRFEITTLDFRAMRKEAKNDFDMALHNFLKRTCRSHKPDELTALFDNPASMALPDVLFEEISPAIGYGAQATVKKPSPSPES